jgi:hypothetical protein
VCTELPFECVNLVDVSNYVQGRFKSYHTYLWWGWSLYSHLSILHIVHVNMQNICRELLCDFEECENNDKYTLNSG